MQNFDEGYIKYHIHWKESGSKSYEGLRELIKIRNQLFKLGLIGVYENGIGFGNISCRVKENKFIISGTQTGGIEKLNEKHFSMVEDCDLQKNELFCSGPVKASSEAMTHFAFYASDKTIQSIIHVHHEKLWNSLLNIVPTTPEEIGYGTPDMANAIAEIIQSQNSTSPKIIVTAGHAEGIFTFGNSIENAFEELMDYFHQQDNK
jgi:ribulose-5-phosphate 4-epimerase/fuculose-1-phosphate aldolase